MQNPELARAARVPELLRAFAPLWLNSGVQRPLFS